MLEGMHIHANGNNLAFLPKGLAKRLAVQEWLRRDAKINGVAQSLASATALLT